MQSFNIPRPFSAKRTMYNKYKLVALDVPSRLYQQTQPKNLLLQQSCFQIFSEQKYYLSTAKLICVAVVALYPHFFSYICFFFSSFMALARDEGNRLPHSSNPPFFPNASKEFKKKIANGVSVFQCKRGSRRKMKGFENSICSFCGRVDSRGRFRSVPQSPLLSSISELHLGG